MELTSLLDHLQKETSEVLFRLVQECMGTGHAQSIAPPTQCSLMGIAFR